MQEESGRHGSVESDQYLTLSNYRIGELEEKMVGDHRVRGGSCNDDKGNGEGAEIIYSHK